MFNSKFESSKLFLFFVFFLFSLTKSFGTGSIDILWSTVSADNLIRLIPMNSVKTETMALSARYDGVFFITEPLTRDVAIELFFRARAEQGQMSGSADVYNQIIRWLQNNENKDFAFAKVESYAAGTNTEVFIIRRNQVYFISFQEDTSSLTPTLGGFFLNSGGFIPRDSRGYFVRPTISIETFIDRILR